MITNCDITIYNHKFNKGTRLDEWHRTIIRGVHFFVDNKVVLGDAGINSANVYKIRIPEDACCESQYVTEDEYENMDNVFGIWTLQNDDYIVLGECSLNIQKPSDLKQAKKRYCKITSWSDNRFGSLPHWRIGGV